MFDAGHSLTSAVFASATRAADVERPLPFETLPSGEYLLTVEVTLGARTVSAKPVRFQVR